ncbi:MAG: four helix bundle protein [Gemmatimonadaceae bacterium]|jgi:four helix bundle protein
MYSFRRLNVWSRAHELTLRVYRLTEGPGFHGYLSLGSQLRRAVSAIPANIAEGAGHVSQAQFNRYLEIAIASSHEAQYHLLLARDLTAIDTTEYAQLEARLIEVQAKLVLLRRRIRQGMGRNAKKGDQLASPPCETG